MLIGLGTIVIASSSRRRPRDALTSSAIVSSGRHLVHGNQLLVPIAHAGLQLDIRGC
jgi:hypothetical protein